MLVLCIHVESICVRIWQEQRIELSPVSIIVTGVIINLRVYKHSLWAHVVCVWLHSTTGRFHFHHHETHTRILSYCLVVLHHTLKLTHASRFPFISLFYIIHFGVLNHNTAYIVLTRVFFGSTICKNLLLKTHFCKRQIGCRITVNVTEMFLKLFFTGYIIKVERGHGKNKANCIEIYPSGDLDFC